MESGKLYVVPTPIGNLKDITLRALEVLEASDIIAAEDTRQSLKLLNHYNIKKPLVSYHKFNEQNKSGSLIEMLKDGRIVALVSDAGSPGISDPGSVIIKKCLEEGIPFEVLPGATAVITALVYSGMDTDKFTFLGFFPRETKDRKRLMEDIRDREETMVIYEAPHRLLEALSFIGDNLGNRQVAVCRELTKIHEEIFRGGILEAIEHFASKQIKGEIVLVIKGKSELEIKEEREKEWADLSVKDHILTYMKQGHSKKDSIKLVAAERGMPKSEVYRHSIEIE